MSDTIPTTMKAVLLTAGGEPLTIGQIQVPRPGPGEVLVKMHASPINPSDLAFLGGDYGIQKSYPTVPGFEGSGTVVAAGKGLLPKLWMGKKVACAASPQYDGCWAEYMKTSAGMCVPLSKNVSLEQGSMMFVNPMTALAFFDVYKKLPNPTKKTRAIINTAGASALGKMVIKLGQKQGIPVIAVVRRQEQVEMLKKEGANYVVNSSSSAFNAELKELAHTLNASVIFDAVGGSMVQTLLDAAPKGSTLFNYGRLAKEACEINLKELLFNGNQIQGFWLTGWLHSKNMVQSLMNTRKIQALLGKELGTTVQQEFPPEEIQKAIEIYTNNMSLGKVLLRFE